MAEDANANIRIGVDTSDAISSVKNLQRQIALLNAQIATGSKTSAANAAKLNQQLIDGVNATGKFSASLTNIKSSTEAFTTALEKNKLSMGQYFRYSMGSTRTFGNFFKKEFSTIQKVAVERVKDLQTQYISLGRDANGALKAIKVRPLALDMQDLSTKTMITAQKMQLMNQLMRQGSTQLLNWGKNTQWAGRQLMVGFTIPLTMFATAAAKSFMDIEKQILKIQRVYGDFSTTVEETKAMTDQIKSLANEYTKYGVAVTDTLNLAADAAAAGKTGQELLSQISEATRLAVLGNVEQTQALETTMSITNAFGVAAEDLAGKIDFLNAVENQSVTSIEDLTVAIPKAGPVVQQLGGDVEDLAFFLTAMKEGGINASEGANALKSGLASLINPTGKAKEMMAGFGINIEKIVSSNKGDIKGLVIDFASALDTLDPLSRARAIEQLFGKFQFSRLSTLFQNVIKDGTQAQRVLELSTATTQELAILSKRELGKIEQTTTYKFEKAFADFQAAIAPVGEEFLKLITPVIEFGTKLLQQFNNMDAGVKQFIVGLTVVLGGIFPALLMTVGLFANGIANILKLVSAVSMMFRRTSGDAGILGNQFEYMTQAEIQAAAAAASLDQVHSKLRQTFTAEKAAVDALTTAYQRNIAAQKGAMGGGATGRKPKPAKYAKGVVSVPGPKGAGDVVPAMLSPGEAVIPADMAKKYGGLINGMVAGNIPGYATGKKVGISDEIKKMGLQSAPNIIKTQTRTMVWDTLDEEMIALEKAVRKVKPDISSDQLRNLMVRQASHIKQDSTPIDFNGRQGNVKNWRAGNLTPDLGAINTYLPRLGKAMPAFLDDIDNVAKKLGMTVKDVRLEAGKLARGEHPVTEKSAKVLREVIRRDTKNMPYAVAGAGAVLDERLKGNFYSTTKNRKYDSSKDSKVADSISRAVDRLQVKLGGTSDGGTQTLTPAQKAAATRKRNAEARAAAAQETQAKRDATNARRREQYALKKEEARIAAQPKPKKPGIGSRIASGVKGMGGMGLGMGVSMAGGAMAMIPGLEGVGSALAMIGPLFMMLPAPIAAVIAALAGLVGIVMSLTAAQEEQRKQAVELGNSLGMGSKQLESMSEDMGTVSLTQQRQAEVNEKLTQTTSEQISAGEQYLTETDSGKKLLEEIKNLQSTGLSAAETGTILGNKISYAISQEVITREQGDGIIAALGTLAGDFAISTAAAATVENTQNLPIAQLAQGGARSTLAATVAQITAAGENATDATRALASSGLMSAYSMALGGEDIINSRYDDLAEELKLEKEKAKTKEEELEIQKEIDSLAGKRETDLRAQRDLQEEIRESIKITFGIIDGQVSPQAKANGGLVMQPYLDMMKTTYAEDSPEYRAAKELMTSENVNKFGTDFVINIGTNLATGDLSPTAMTTIMGYAAENETFSTEYNAMITASGDIETLKTIGALQSAGADGEVITVALTLINDGASAEDVIDATTTLMSGQMSGFKVEVDDEGLQTYIEDLKEAQDSMPKDGKFTTEFVSDYVGGDEAAKAVLDSKAFQKLPKKQKAEYLATYKAFLTGGIDKGSDAYTAWKTLMNKTGEDTSDSAFIRWTLSKIENAGGSTDPDTDPPGPGPGPSGSKPEDKKLSKYNKKIDKRQKALSVIALKEDAINKKYEERAKALQEISKLNSEIADQQKAQLDIASALASGDIAAAARAVQGERARAAGFAQDQQMKALEDQKQAELGNLSYAGWSRKSLEASLAYWQMKAATREYKLASSGGFMKLATGGKVMSYFSGGGRGKPLGSDTIPAMLTPGEFVVKRPAVQGFGVKNLEAINSGKSPSGSVYTYNVNVNVATNSDPDKIARTVVTKIRSIDKQRLGGNSY